MMIGSVVRDVLLKNLNQWKEYISVNRADTYTENLENMLLFHASFSNLIDEGFQRKIRQVYEYFLSKLELNQDRKLLVFDYAPIIMLEKIFTDYAQDEDAYFHKIIHMTSSRNAGTRYFSTRLLTFYLSKNVDFKNEVLGVSLKDLFVKSAYNNIEAGYFDNIYLFALIHFLNIPKPEKQEIFASLLDFAKESEASHDISNLEKISKQKEPIANPFYTYFHECLQNALKTIISLDFNPKKLTVGVQLDLFNQPILPQFHYDFEDVRLKYYLE
jgi:hypothetical protein